MKTVQKHSHARCSILYCSWSVIRESFSNIYLVIVFLLNISTYFIASERTSERTDKLS